MIESFITNLLLQNGFLWDLQASLWHIFQLTIFGNEQNIQNIILI